MVLSMSKDWQREKRQDHFYRRAKSSGKRSRAYYKIQQMDKKFRILQQGNSVVDLGAAPGGWTEYAVERVGRGGKVVAIDRDPMDHVKGATFVLGDMTDPATAEEVIERVGKADLVLSDMSPDISGNYSVDQARSAYLVTIVLNFSRQVVRPGGSMVAKVFEGEDFKDLLIDIRSSYRKVKVHSPPASRAQSSEIYVIARGFDPKKVKNDTVD